MLVVGAKFFFAGGEGSAFGFVGREELCCCTGEKEVVGVGEEGLLLCDDDDDSMKGLKGALGAETDLGTGGE